MKRNILAASVLLIAVAGVMTFVAQAPTLSRQARSPTNAPESSFITVNGVQLHYLDWGGTGEAQLFLTALGGTANDFQPLAVHFTDQFHVLGLTRRGQGQSEKPDTGYDTFTLTEDIKAFLDAMRVKRVTLVGYSLAGNEETEFAGRYPQRVAKLVYLDAAYDLAENEEHRRQTDLPPLSGVDKVTLELIDRSNEYHPETIHASKRPLSVSLSRMTSLQNSQPGMRPPRRNCWQTGTTTEKLTGACRQAADQHGFYSVLFAALVSSDGGNVRSLIACYR